MIKVLNLYAGIGGNCKLWPSDEIEVTAIENNPQIAKAYQYFFPDDTVIVTDAHKYLENHIDDFDFIWSSPPCPTHSRLKIAGVAATRLGNTGCIKHIQKPIFPDMKLYEEILFLDAYSQKRYCIENVISFYKPLIIPKKVNRHYFWSNFVISDINKEKVKRQALKNVLEFKPKKQCEDFGFEFDVIPNSLEYPRDKIIRNLIHPELGLHIFNCAFKLKQSKLGK